VAHLEQALSHDIDHPKFVPYLAVHEFEALLFAAPEEIAARLAQEGVADDLRTVKSRFTSPEEIDDKKPPSKCILTLLPGYRKPLHGPLITQAIGLQRIRAECGHFDEWLSKLERLGQS
jgi:hypothetical protein